MIALILSIFTIVTSFQCTYTFPLTNSQQVYPPITPISIQQATLINPQNSKQCFYKLNFINKTCLTNQYLIISVYSSLRTLISIYINVQSIYNNKNLQQVIPRFGQAQQQCQNINIVSCPIFGVQNGSVIYFTVFVRDPVQYMIYIAKQSIIPFKILDQRNNLSIQTLKFDNNFAQLFQLDFNQNNTTNKQLILNAQYLFDGTINGQKLFTITAGSLIVQQGNIIMQQTNIGYSFGALRKQIKLPPSSSQPYLILISGAIGLQLILHFQIPSSNLSLSQPVNYLYDLSKDSYFNQITEFTFDTISVRQIDQLNGLSVYLQRLRGFGTFAISSCNFSYNFTPHYGEYAYVLIPKTAMTCTDHLIKIKLINVIWQMGISIIIQPSLQEQNQNTILYLGEKRVQITQQTPTPNCKTYPIQIPSSIFDENISLIYSTGLSNKQVTLISCQKDMIKNENKCLQDKFFMMQNQNQLLFYQNNNLSNYITVCYNDTNNIYNNYITLLVIQYPHVIQLNLYQQSQSYIIKSGQTILFKLVNFTKKFLQINVKIINGEIFLYHNCSTQPNINNNDGQNLFCSYTDDSIWNYTIVFEVNQLKNSTKIFGIEALSESLVTLDIVIREYPTPDPNPQILHLQDGVNNLIIQPNTSTVVSYQSHLIPYNISFSQQLLINNFCIQIFKNQQQMTNIKICSNTINAQYTLTTIYLRISNPNIHTIFNKFQINIILPQLILQIDNPILLSCKQFCYTNILVRTNISSNISITGPGYLNITDSYFTDIIQIQSITSGIYITATLPEGGNLHIQMGKLPLVVSQKTTLQQKVAQKIHLIVPLNSSFSTFLINSGGSSFQAYWSLASINQLQENSIYYSYPTQTNNLLYSSPRFVDPIVPIILSNLLKNRNLQANHCYQQTNFYCFLVISIIKHWNEQNFQFQFPSIYEFTLNTSVYYLQLNQAITVLNSFGSVYLNPMIVPNTKQQNNYSIAFQITQQHLTINLLSSCSSMYLQLITNNFSLNSDNQSSFTSLQILSTRLCVLSVVAASCPYPFIYPGLMLQLNFSEQFVYSGLFKLQKGPSGFSFIIWTTDEIGSQPISNRTVKQLLVSIYRIQNQKTCQTSQYNFIKTLTLSLSPSNKMYLQNQTKISSIQFNSQDQGKLFIIQIFTMDANQVKLQKTNIFIIMKDNKLPLILLANMEPIPLPSPNSINNLTFVHYAPSDKPQFQICFNSQLSPQQIYQLTIIIAINDQQVSNSTIRFSQTGCAMIKNSSSKQSLNNNIQMLKYTIIVISSSLYYNKKYFNILWIQIKSSLTFFQIYQFTIMSLPSNSFIKMYSKKIGGKCYAVTPLLTTEYDVIYYFKQPLNNDIYNVLTSLNSTKMTASKQIKSQKDGKLLGYRIKIKPNELLQPIGSCFYTDYGYYIGVQNSNPNFIVIINQQTIFKTLKQQIIMPTHIFKYVSISNFNSLTANFTQQQNHISNQLYLVIQIIQCSSKNNSLILLDQTQQNNSENSKIAQYQNIFNKYNVKAAIYKISNSGQLYIGVKSTSNQSLSYTFRTYQTNNSELPHTNWQIMGQNIYKAQVQQNNYLIIQLPAVKSIKNYSLLPQLIRYQIYITNNSDIKHINIGRCPFIQNQFISSKIFNVSIQNPITTPFFKILVSQLPSLNISIFAQVSIFQTLDSMPFTFLYQTDTMILQSLKNYGNNQNGLGLLFLILAVSIFFVLLSRLVYKTVKQRKQNRNIQFQMSLARSQPQQSHQNNNNNNKSVIKQYVQFIDQTISS